MVFSGCGVGGDCWSVERDVVGVDMVSSFAISVCSG